MNLEPFVCYVTPVQWLLNQINHYNRSLFQAHELVFSTPETIDHTLTRIKVAPSCESNRTGVQEIRYHRLDLTAFFHGRDVVIETNDPVTPEFLQDYFLTHYKLHFDPDHLQIEKRYINQYLAQVITLRATAESLMWIGSVTIWQVRENDIGLSLRHFKTHLNQPCIKQNAYLYSIDAGLDQCRLPHPLNTLEVGTRFHTLTPEWLHFTEYLSALTGDPWVIDTTQTVDFNLYQARVTHQGSLSQMIAPDTLETLDGVDPIDWQVMVIQLGDACKNLFGSLVFLYQPQDID